MTKIKTKHSRSIAKAITWRVLASFTTTIIVYVATGSFSLSLGVGFFDIIIKLALYYFHERAWDKTDWGRK